MLGKFWFSEGFCENVCMYIVCWVVGKFGFVLSYKLVYEMVVDRNVFCVGVKMSGCD